MANTFSNAFITQWNTELKIAYQQQGSKLRNAVRWVSGVTGSTHKFPKLGTTAAVTQAATGDLILPANEPAHSNVTATLVDRHTANWLGQLDEFKTNVNYRSDYTKAGAMALGRETDDLIVAAMDAATPGATIPHGTTGLTLDKVLATSQKMNEAEVPEENRIFVVSPAAISDLLADPKVTSTDYVPVRNLMNGKVQTFLGFTFICSNRLSVATNIRDCYAFDKMAIGVASGADIKTTVSFINERAAHYIRSCMSMGAVVIDEAGLIKVQVDET